SPRLRDLKDHLDATHPRGLRGEEIDTCGGQQGFEERRFKFGGGCVGEVKSESVLWLLEEGQLEERGFKFGGGCTGEARAEVGGVDVDAGGV
ncbi:Hypothetical predicted protein, partial [Olea europaea subsp. europaea]